VLRREADVVALQEITTATHDAWLEHLSSAGYEVLSTLPLLDIHYPPPIKRTYCNILAARYPITPLPGLSFPDPEQRRVAFPEKYLAARIVCDGASIDVHNAHIPPGSSRGIIKPHAFQAIRRRIDEDAGHPQILCGDFNSQASEDDDGVTTWGYRHPSLREMWDAAERSILKHPRLHDVYRALRARGDPWEWSHRTKSGPKRYDHIYASADLEPRSCRYWSAWIDEKLSDHAAVEADLVLAERPKARDGW
jgi:endonuclease/exonuclease/phosphatase family metal-dependent hydrolase